MGRPYRIHYGNADGVITSVNRSSQAEALSIAKELAKQPENVAVWVSCGTWESPYTLFDTRNHTEHCWL
jgi:muconolactone delta-isomerase